MGFGICGRTFTTLGRKGLMIGLIRHCYPLLSSPHFVVSNGKVEQNKQMNTLPSITRGISTTPVPSRNTRFILTSNSSTPPPIQPPTLNPIDKLGTCDEIYLVQKGCSKEEESLNVRMEYKYDVTDASGEKIFYAIQKYESCPPAFELKLCDYDGKVLVSHKLLQCLSSHLLNMQIICPGGIYLGSIEEKIDLNLDANPIFELKNSCEELQAVVLSDFSTSALRRSIKILAPDRKASIGKISKRWGGFKYDNLVLRIRLPKEMESSSRASLIGLSILLPLPPYSDEDLKEMPEGLNGLTNASKIRVNQFKLIRLGMKPAKIESIRDFEVVNVLTDPPTPLLYIRIYHSVIVEKYHISFYQKIPDGSANNPCLAKLELDRNVDLRSISAKIFSPPKKFVGYVYDLEGVYRTAIVENGKGKCIYQLQTRSPSGWTGYTLGRIFSRDGVRYLGHFKKLQGYHRRRLMLYMSIRENIDTLSKCTLIAASVFLTGYDYVR
ncbi:Phospholipid scramblase family member 5 [Orchesella cincta]|uniref:Phospholipid scramblase family member 5 n=1 Tax=Orchesella cincta TaxID=48709 RepID=A0A1D2NAJ6_ORCCI|nr:Phospholipid scramblase family member 5 [Orchesella cincta]